MSRRQDAKAAGLRAVALDMPAVAQRRPGRAFKRRLRILVCSQNHAPEVIGIGKYTGEMVAWLSEQGAKVRVVAAPPYYPAWQVEPGFRAYGYRRERRDGAVVYRCPLWVPSHPTGLRRVLHLLSFAISSLPVTLWQGLVWRPDVVIAVEPPLLAAPGALLAARLAGARCWLHVQDFEVDAAVNLGLVKPGLPLRLANGIERLMLGHFDRISSISSRMLQRLRDKGVPEEKISFLPNWVDADVIRPLGEPSPFRRTLGIGLDVTVALYSGNMGAKQGLEMLARAAQVLKHREDILFVFAGDGSARASLEASVAGLPNVRFLPLQPTEQLNALLNLADVHLLPQRREAADLVMPSKLTGMLASGRPVIAGAETGTQVASVVHDCGIVVPPENGDAMATAVAHLADHKDRRLALGEAARRMAVVEWGKEATLREFAAELCALVGDEPAEDAESPASERPSASETG